MTLGLRFQVTGDESFVQYLRDFPQVARKAAKLSINDTVRRGRRQLRRELQSQLNYPGGYLNQERLYENFASESNLVGSVVGRRRPTSLARFDAKQLYQNNLTKKGKKRAGVTVRVKQRRARIPRGFLMNLKSGAKDGGNVGLAIRVPDGQRPKRRFNAKPLYKDRNTNLYLLYGPSVNQAMTSERKGQSMVQKLQPGLNSYLNTEFRRQFGRLYRG